VQVLVRLLPLASAALAALAALAPVRSAALDPEAAATVMDPTPATSVVDERVGADPSAASTQVNAATRDDLEGEGNWLDIGHAYIEHRIFAPVLRVDRFFSDERDLEPERARSFIQWRQELRFQQYRTSSFPIYSTTIGANLKFPGLNQELRKFQIEISGQTRDAFTALFPGDHASPGEVPASETGSGRADAGLGYRLFDTVSSAAATHGDVGAGIIFALPPGVYTRARLRFAESLGKKLLFRQAISGFWRTDTRLGTTASASVERPLAYATLARLSGSSTLTQRSRGVEWGGDLSLLGTLRARIGAQLGFNVSGATRAPVGVDIYRFYLRLRRDVYRKWIFLELDPEYAWPWEPDVGRRGTWAVSLRLEVQFQGNEAPRVRAPAEPEAGEPVEPIPERSDPPDALPRAPGPG
jgi:hypothetical protein